MVARRFRLWVWRTEGRFDDLCIVELRVMAFRELLYSLRIHGNEVYECHQCFMVWPRPLIRVSEDPAVMLPYVVH
jgi:hypothetical protein